MKHHVTIVDGCPDESINLLCDALRQYGLKDVKCGRIMLPGADWQLHFESPDPKPEPPEQPSAFDLNFGSR